MPTAAPWSRSWTAASCAAPPKSRADDDQATQGSTLVEARAPPSDTPNGVRRDDRKRLAHTLPGADSQGVLPPGERSGGGPDGLVPMVHAPPHTLGRFGATTRGGPLTEGVAALPRRRDRRMLACSPDGAVTAGCSSGTSRVTTRGNTTVQSLWWWPSRSPVPTGSPAHDDGPPRACAQPCAVDVRPPCPAAVSRGATGTRGGRHSGHHVAAVRDWARPGGPGAGGRRAHGHPHPPAGDAVQRRGGRRGAEAQGWQELGAPGPPPAERCPGGAVPAGAAPVRRGRRSARGAAVEPLPVAAGTGRRCSHRRRPGADPAGGRHGHGRRRGRVRVVGAGAGPARLRR